MARNDSQPAPETKPIETSPTETKPVVTTIVAGKAVGDDKMLRLTMYKAGTAFLLAFLAPIAAGLHEANGTKAWVALILGGLISGLTALRSFFDQSFARDPSSRDS